MRRIVSSLLAMLLGVAAVGLSALPASAATAITAPTANPFSVPGNASGDPVAFTISASGFGANVSFLATDLNHRLTPFNGASSLVLSASIRPSPARLP